MGRKPSRIKRRKEEDPIWFRYKKPTKKGIFYHTFQKNALAAGNPPASIIDKKELNSQVAEFLKSFKVIESFDLDYLQSLLPIRYCYLLPRNYAALLFALHINAYAEANGLSFLDCFKSIDGLNNYFEKPESPEKYYDAFLMNSYFREKFENLFFSKSKAGIYYLFNAKMECPDVFQQLYIILLFDLAIFRDPSQKFHAFLNFPSPFTQEIPEGIAIFENKKKLRNAQEIEVFYVSGEDSINVSKFHWAPHAHINKKKWLGWNGIKWRGFKRYFEKEAYITYREVRKVIERHNPKILAKHEAKSFIKSLDSPKIKKVCNLTKNFKVYLPREQIIIKNYYLYLNLVPSFLKGYTSRSGETLASWFMYRTYPLEATSYSIMKRCLFLYNLVGPFRTILGLKKRKIRRGKVEFYTPDVCEEISSEIREKLKEYATPSQVLLKIVENAKQNQGNVEDCLKYIRGIYRASRKISLLLKNKEFDLIPKVVERYL